MNSLTFVTVCMQWNVCIWKRAAAAAAGSSKANFKTSSDKVSLCVPGNSRDSNIHLSPPRASQPVSVYMHRFILKVNFWHILLSFFGGGKKAPYARSTATAFPRRGKAAVHCGSGLLHSPGMEANRKRAGVRQLPTEWGLLRWRGDEQNVSDLCLPSSGKHFHVHKHRFCYCLFTLNTSCVWK